MMRPGAEGIRDLMAKAALILAGLWLGVYLTGRPPQAAPPAPAQMTPVKEGGQEEGGPPECDAELVVGHVRALAEEIGPRPAGSPEERRAASYLAGYLRGLGDPVTESGNIPLPGGDSSTGNVIAWQSPAGADGPALLIGAHYDSARCEPPSPGGNDNASGVAALLETARLCRDLQPPCALCFAGFGGEEPADDDPDHHHFGSRHFYAHQGRPLAAMISVDMVGVGERLYLRYVEPAPEPLLEMLERAASHAGIAVARRPDELGCSDHEPFAAGGLPAVWLERLEDPAQHTDADSADRVQPVYVQSAVTLLVEFVGGLTREDLDALVAWSDDWSLLAHTSR